MYGVVVWIWWPGVEVVVVEVVDVVDVVEVVVGVVFVNEVVVYSHGMHLATGQQSASMICRS